MILFRIVRFGALGALGWALAISAVESQEKSAPQQPRGASGVEAGTATSAVPVYKPPPRGTPGGRVGGGTRGSAPREDFTLLVLAPDHTGLTVSEQPSLYWFISSPTSHPIDVTLVDPRATRPVLEVQIPPPIRHGVHSFRLAAHNVRLETGVPYRWFVAVVSDSNRRSRDILAGGTIERIEVSEALRTKLSEARPKALPFIYAEAGLWYDAVAAISELIERAPGDGDLQRQRTALFTQVGLPAIDDR